MDINDKLLTLSKQLFPTGRAWWMPNGGIFEKLMKGLLASEARAYNDAVSILDSALPDNDNFTSDDATAWETRLGLITNIFVPLGDRKLAIARKMSHPGTVKARQNYLYIQGQLQAAGFNVYVYENRFPSGGGYVTKTPGEFSIPPYPGEPIQHGDSQHGDFQHNGGGGGGSDANKIANSIEQSIDDTFLVYPTYRSTFFIGGSTPGTWADVNANREKEFRQTILRLKPVQMVGFLLVNYV